MLSSIRFLLFLISKVQDNYEIFSVATTKVKEKGLIRTISLDLGIGDNNRM